MVAVPRRFRYVRGGQTCEAAEVIPKHVCELRAAALGRPAGLDIKASRCLVIC